MQSTFNHAKFDHSNIPQAVMQALVRHPQALSQILDEAGVAPHEVALWARQAGIEGDIEQRAGWLSVGKRPGAYKPLLELAGSHLRGQALVEALPLFRWAFLAWRDADPGSARYYADGAKLLAQWGACLYRLGQGGEARRRWLEALNAIRTEEDLGRLLRMIEACEATRDYDIIIEQALRRNLPGAGGLWRRWQRLQDGTVDAHAESRDSITPEGVPDSHVIGHDEATTDAAATGGVATGIAVMADVANLDMVCRDQYGYQQRLDYGRLLAASARRGPVRAKIAFVPDIPETRETQAHLEEAGFTVDLLTPKRSHGRLAANADTAMAAYAVRWASSDEVGRLELWTGDGDFLRVRDAVQQAWPEVVVAFRSFEVGTAAAIKALGSAWEPIAASTLRSRTDDGAPFRYLR
jgi:hypothetical protein